MAAVAKEL
jgi:hypothetical protein